MTNPTWSWDADRKQWRAKVELNFPQNFLAEENIASFSALIDEYMIQLKTRLLAVNNDGNSRR